MLNIINENVKLNIALTLAISATNQLNQNKSSKLINILIDKTRFLITTILIIKIVRIEIFNFSFNFVLLINTNSQFIIINNIYSNNVNFTTIIKSINIITINNFATIKTRKTIQINSTFKVNSQARSNRR